MKTSRANLQLNERRRSQIIPALLAILWIAGSGVLSVKADRATFDPTRTQVAFPLDTPPTIDGNIETAEWNRAGGFNGQWRVHPDTTALDGINGGIIAFGPVPDDADDLSFTISAGYDATNLYIAVQVRDSVIMTDTAEAGSKNGNTWQDDSVEVFVDGNNANDAAWSTNNPGGQFVITANNAYREQEAGNPGYGPDAAWYAQTAPRADGSGYDAEFRISLATLGNPKPGDIIGFTVGVNDDDDGGPAAKRQVLWIGEPHKPVTYGNLLLGPRSYTAPLVTTAPVVDGKIDPAEYAGAAKVHLGGAVGIWDIGAGEDNIPEASLNYDWWVVHTADAIYVAANVVDDQVINDNADAGPGSEDGTTWEDDSVEIFFDGDNNKNTGRGDFNFEGQYVFTANGARRDNEASNPTFGTNSDEWFAATSRTATGYQVEFRIPKVNLQNPTNGFTMGFLIAVNDDNGPGPLLPGDQLTWFGASHRESTYGNLTLLASGGTPPPATGRLTITGNPDFGQTVLGGSGVEGTFTIANVGTAPVNLSGAPKVAVTGPQAGDFTVTAQPATPIPAGGNSSFTIRFAPTAAGARNATVSIQNDGDKNPFDLAITGTGTVATTGFADVVGYFKFDTFPGDNDGFTDDAGKGLHGLLGYPFSQPGSEPGPSGLAGDLAVSFDGKGGLVVDDSAAQVLNILTPPLTLECWVRATNFSNRYLGFVSYGIPGGPPVAGVVRGGYKLGIAPNGNILFTLFAVVDVDSGIPYPFDGAWHHVAAIYSIPDGGVTFYLDGQNVAFVAETRAISPPGNRQLDIGAQWTGLRGFEGAVDRVRISKAILTPAQLDSVAGTVKPVGNDTVAFFNFDEAKPPYQGQGLPPAGVAIASADWVINHPPYTSDGDPAKVTDTPSGAATDIALQFDVSGADAIDMAAVSDPNGVLNLNGDWTLEAWVKYSANVTGDRDVIFYYGSPGHGYSLSVNYAAGNKLQVTTLGKADMPSDTAVVEPDVWQHVAVVHKDGQSITYFTNGVQAGVLSYTGGTFPATTNKVLYIGAEWNGGLPFTGFIDRVRISNSALTASQLDSDPKNPATSPPPPAAQLKIVEIKPALTTGDITLTWEGDGPQFQVEKATTVTGTFQPLGAVQSAKVYTDAGALKAAAQNFYRINQISTAPPPVTCSTAVAGAGFVNTAMTNQTGIFSVEFEATPSASPINSVMALSSGPQTGYPGFACLVRFFTDGFIEARNGGDYAPLPGVIPYSAGVKYSFRFVVNVPAHTYSIYVTPAGGTELTVGTDFDFRSEQNAVANLDNWAVTVDSTSAGTNTVCNFKLVP